MLNEKNSAGKLIDRCNNIKKSITKIQIGILNLQLIMNTKINKINKR